jgi:WD40 repeat protein
MTKFAQVIVDGVPRSVDFSRYLLVGMRNGSIVECDIDKTIKETTMYSHHDGEVWGLCVIDDKYFVTSCDDNKILMFDLEQRKLVQKGNVDPTSEDGQSSIRESVKSRPDRGAATTSKSPPSQQSRALAYNSKLRHLAVATNCGVVTIREIVFSKTLQQDLNTLLVILRDPQEWIECMAYNP